MRQPAQPPAPPQPPAQAGDYQVKIGKDGIKVSQAGAESMANLEAQAQVLKARIEKLKAEIAETKAELTSSTAGAASAANQVRLVSLESRRTDAEEQLQRVEDLLALQGVTPATVSEIGFPGEPIVPFDPNREELQEKVAMIAVFAILFIGAPIAIAISRFIWKRTVSRPAPAPASSNDDPRRLERVEQAVEAIAVEMERMSEGQRYVTRILAERAGAPAARDVPVRAGDRVER
jgi:chromosome segregation ATPase